MFPHNSKVVTLDQITYHDPKLTMNPKNVLPAVEGSLSMPSFMDVGPRRFRDSTMIGTYESIRTSSTSSKERPRYEGTAVLWKQYHVVASVSTPMGSIDDSSSVLAPCVMDC